MGDTPSTGNAPDPKPGGRKLEFGIYPGGVAGQIVVPAVPKPEDRAKTLQALARLRPAGGPFTVHIYRSYLDAQNDAKEDVEHRRLVDLYTGHGYGVEIVIRYRRDGDPAGFAKFVRGVVGRFGDNPLVRGFQVTNEVNFAASGDSSDGVYEGARDALIQGVIAAKDEARRRGYDQVQIGFNWFYRTDPNNEDSFWQYLDEHGGKRFSSSLDWVGLDVYPGTFFPPATPPAATGDFVVNALSQLRNCFMDEGDIPESVPIHVEENGYPTGPGRSYADQRTALESMVGAVNTYRANYNVTNYFWFDLRDADTASPNFQQQYGLMRDDYSPKPAFDAFRGLVSQMSLRAKPPPAVRPPGRNRGTLLLRVRCWRSGVYAQVRGSAARRIRRVRFSANGRHFDDLGGPWRRHMRLVPTRRRVRIGVRARVTLPARRVELRRSLRCRVRE
ncbi:MAG TPA: hypothetical protein VJT75_03110 [Thermoleophilaceae bacterium]|nr:hypothetical protein [Thermoleophilaceae bacterium]